VLRIRIDEQAYPSALYDLEVPPALLTTSGPLEAERAVAIVGSRDASEEARDFAFALAYFLARAGVVVVSGGALGVDRAAHDGAIAGGGATWVVMPTGRGRVAPPSHRAFFAEIERSPTSRIVWPFPDGTAVTAEHFRERNGIAVALAECLVVVQARFASGSRNAARWARQLGRPLWLVPAMPWCREFSGTIEEGAAEAEDGAAVARTLWSIEGFHRALSLPPPDMNDTGARRRDAMPPRAKVPRQPRIRQSFGRRAAPASFEPSSWSTEEKSVFSCLSLGPTHRDKVIEKTRLPVSAAVTALLTLSLKDVVVEGPDGFFRRRRAT
jgi:DNA processing protein